MSFEPDYAVGDSVSIYVGPGEDRIVGEVRRINEPRNLVHVAIPGPRGNKMIAERTLRQCRKVHGDV